MSAPSWVPVAVAAARHVARRWRFGAADADDLAQEVCTALATAPPAIETPVGHVRRAAHALAHRLAREARQRDRGARSSLHAYREACDAATPAPTPERLALQRQQFALARHVLTHRATPAEVAAYETWIEGGTALQAAVWRGAPVAAVAAAASARPELRAAARELGLPGLDNELRCTLGERLRWRDLFAALPALARTARAA